MHRSHKQNAIIPCQRDKSSRRRRKQRRAANPARLCSSSAPSMDKSAAAFAAVHCRFKKIRRRTGTMPASREPLAANARAAPSSSMRVEPLIARPAAMQTAALIPANTKLNTAPHISSREPAHPANPHVRGCIIDMQIVLPQAAVVRNPSNGRWCHSADQNIMQSIHLKCIGNMPNAARAALLIDQYFYDIKPRLFRCRILEQPALRGLNQSFALARCHRFARRAPLLSGAGFDFRKNQIARIRTDNIYLTVLPAIIPRQNHISMPLRKNSAARCSPRCPVVIC